MSHLLLNLVIYLGVGFLEWFLALRRTIAAAKGEHLWVAGIVGVENLLALFVLANFVETNNWMIAICYSIGGAAGAFCCSKKFNNVK